MTNAYMQTSIKRLLLLSLFLAFSACVAFAQDGEALFNNNCKTCHSPFEKVVGPALKGVENRHSEEWLLKWIHNAPGMIKSGDAEAVKLYNDNGKQQMTVFTNLKEDEIKAILTYIKDVKPPAAAVTQKPVDEEGGEEEGGSTWIYLLGAAVVLYLVSGVLRRTQETLAHAVRKRNGIPDPVPMSRWNGFVHWARNNKKLLAVILIIVFMYGSVKAWYSLKDIGVTQGYRPEQPIKYSHKLHAGDMKISCIYCHSGAERGKTAGVPSLNVCMNCHKFVKQGPTGDKTEIAKIYKALDYDPDKGTYGPNPKPIQWTRVHNLPDLAYFNHSQHFVVGKIECQTCHGPVQDSMTVAYQYSMLTMGWCIDCHRRTPVQMANNAYYNDYHKDLLSKYGSDSLLTVERIGGTECARCHY
jgi:cytochrome c2